MFVDVMFFFILTRYLSSTNSFIKKVKDKLNSKKYKYVIAVVIVVLVTAIMSIFNLKQVAMDAIFFGLFGVMISLLENNK